MTNQSIDKVLDVLKDGKWHTPEEITNRTRIEEPKIKLITSFIQRFQFIQIDKKGKIKLTSLTKKFLEKTDPAPFYEEITA